MAQCSEIWGKNGDMLLKLFLYPKRSLKKLRKDKRIEKNIINKQTNKQSVDGTDIKNKIITINHELKTKPNIIRDKRTTVKRIK